MDVNMELINEMRNVIDSWLRSASMEEGILDPKALANYIREARHIVDCNANISSADVTDANLNFLMMFRK